MVYWKFGEELENVTYQMKFSIQLYSRSPVKLLNWQYDGVTHAGQGITINQIRSSGFWIISCNSLVRSMIGKCIRWDENFNNRRWQICQKIGCVQNHQLHMVLIFLSHLWQKKSWKEVKNYGEVVHSTSTDLFILSLRRFIRQRGIVRTIRSMEQISLMHQQNLYVPFKKWMTRKLVIL